MKIFEMKKFIVLILLIIVSFSCSTNKNCGDIVTKFIQDGKYYFALTAFGGDDNSGDIYGDVEVSKEIYDSFAIGDQYCIE